VNFHLRNGIAAPAVVSIVRCPSASRNTLFLCGAHASVSPHLHGSTEAYLHSGKPGICKGMGSCMQPRRCRALCKLKSERLSFELAPVRARI